MRKKQEALVQKTPLYLILILVLGLGLIFSVLLAVTFGSSPIPFSDVYRVILNQLFGIGDDAVYGTARFDTRWKPWAGEGCDTDDE